MMRLQNSGRWHPTSTRKDIECAHTCSNFINNSVLFTRHSRSIISAVYIVSLSRCFCTLYAKLGVYFKIHRTMCAMQEKNGSSESWRKGFLYLKTESGILSLFLSRGLYIPFIGIFLMMFLCIVYSLERAHVGMHVNRNAK